MNLGWLGFGLLDAEKSQKFQLTSFFAFLSRHYGITNYFEILHFLFSNIIPGGVVTCQILLF